MIDPFLKDVVFKQSASTAQMHESSAFGAQKFDQRKRGLAGVLAVVIEGKANQEVQIGSGVLIPHFQDWNSCIDEDYSYSWVFTAAHCVSYWDTRMNFFDVIRVRIPQTEKFKDYHNMMPGPSEAFQTGRFEDKIVSPEDIHICPLYYRNGGSSYFGTDAALIKLKLPVVRKFQQFQQFSSDLARECSFTVVGFPGEADKMYIPFHGSLYTEKEPHIREEYPGFQLMVHNTYTTHGQSGGPILLSKNDQTLVCGIHVLGGSSPSGTLLAPKMYDWIRFEQSSPSELMSSLYQYMPQYGGVMKRMDKEWLSAEVRRLKPQVNMTNDCEETPLMYAMTKGRKSDQIVWRLLKKGADVNLVDINGCSAFDWADRHASDVHSRGYKFNNYLKVLCALQLTSTRIESSLWISLEIMCLLVDWYLRKDMDFVVDSNVVYLRIILIGLLSLYLCRLIYSICFPTHRKFRITYVAWIITDITFVLSLIYTVYDTISFWNDQNFDGAIIGTTFCFLLLLGLIRRVYVGITGILLKRGLVQIFLRLWSVLYFFLCCKSCRRKLKKLRTDWREPLLNDSRSPIRASGYVQGAIN